MWMLGWRHKADMINNENKHLLIRDVLLERIASGQYKDMIPPSRQLASEFGVNIKTLDKAIGALESEGMLSRSKGKGTFIVSDRPRPAEAQASRRLIGVVSPMPEEMKESWLSLTLKGIQAAAARAGVNIVLKGHAGTLDTERDALKELAGSGIEGLLAYPFIADDGRTNSGLYKKLNIPLVLFDRLFDDLDTDFAGVDHYAAGRLATETLISRGHVRIAHIAPSGRVRNTEDRIAGYKDALAGAGIPFSAAYCPRLETYGDSEAVKRTLEDLMSMGKDAPTAIFASHDGFTLALYAAAHEIGIRIPDELSLVGFGNAWAAESLGISSIDQSLDGTGRLAAELLLERLGGRRSGGPCIHTMLPVSLIDRKSIKRLG